MLHYLGCFLYLCALTGMDFHFPAVFGHGNFFNSIIYLGNKWFDHRICDTMLGFRLFSEFCGHILMGNSSPLRFKK